MCGISGVLGQPSRANRHVFQDMLCYGVKRGPHSTGLFVANRKASFLLKDASLPWDLLRQPAYNENVPGKNWPLMMGHNRWATIGKISKDNAHPFQHQHITLMHNGTLEKRSDLEDWYKFDTDSECLTFNIAKYGIKDVYKTLEGAWTLAWADANSGTLNVVSNGLRPFNFIMAADKKSMYFSSEDWVIRFAAEGRGIALDKQCWTLNSHKLYSFFIKKNGEVDFTTEDLEHRLPFVKKYAKEDFAYLTAGRGWDEDEGELMGFIGGTPSSDASVPPVGPKTLTTGSNNVIVLDDKGHPVGAHYNAAGSKVYPFGPVKKLMTSEQYLARFQTTDCVLCGCDIKDEYDDALLVDPETVACGSCHKFCELNHVKLVEGGTTK